MTVQYKVHYSLKPLMLLIQYSYTQIQLQKAKAAVPNARQVRHS